MFREPEYNGQNWTQLYIIQLLWVVCVEHWFIRPRDILKSKKISRVVFAPWHWWRRKEWFNQGNPHVILDNLYAAKTLAPMIVVLPNGRAMKMTVPSETLWKVQKCRLCYFRKDLLNDLIPYIEKTFRYWRIRKTERCRIVDGWRTVVKLWSWQSEYLCMGWWLFVGSEYKISTGTDCRKCRKNAKKKLQTPLDFVRRQKIRINNLQ